MERSSCEDCNWRHQWTLTLPWQAFGLPNFTYEDSLSNAVRVTIHQFAGVLRERGASRNHHFSTPRNGSNSKVYPSKLFFLPKAAEEGGPLNCSSDVLWELIEKELPELAQNCSENERTQVFECNACRGGLGFGNGAKLAKHPQRQFATRSRSPTLQA